MPEMAFCEMSLPHDGPMNELVTLVTSTSYASAKAFLTSVTSSLVRVEVWMRSASEPTVVTFGCSSGETSSTVSMATCWSWLVTPETMNCEPPRNSMPGLRPGLIRRITERTTRTVEIVNQILRRPTMSYDRRPV